MSDSMGESAVNLEPSRFRRQPDRWAVLLACITALAVGDLRAQDPAFAQGTHLGHSGHAGMAMSAESMERAARDWFAAHPARGENSALAPSDSFLVASFYFDENHDGFATQVDTARIVQGQVVLWKWVGGSHTITSGTGASDPQAGVLFDQPINSISPSFSFQFNSVGVFPFFCRPHEAFNMKGVVVVSAPAAVEPVSPPAGRAGFRRSPWPNPTRGTASFEFALTRSGRARAFVLDPQGRRVTTLFDRDFVAGTYRSSWDGRIQAGGIAPPGVYLLRLEWPGSAAARLMTVER
jgi:plastocyanin